MNNSEVPVDCLNQQNNQNVQQRPPTSRCNEKYTLLPHYDTTILSPEGYPASDEGDAALSEESNTQDVGDANVTTPPEESVVDSCVSDTTGDNTVGVTTSEEPSVADHEAVSDLDDAKEPIPSETPTTSEQRTVQDHKNLHDGFNNTPSEAPTGQNVEGVADLDVSKVTISEGDVRQIYGDGYQMTQIVMKNNLSYAFYSVLELSGPQGTTETVVTLPFSHITQ